MQPTKADKEIINEALRWVRDNDGMTVKGQNYMSPRISSEVIDCSMPLSFDSLSRCSLGCLYCFAYYQKAYNPNMAQYGPAPLYSINPKNFIASLTGQGGGKAYEQFYKYFYKQRFLLHWGGMADPFCNFEKKNRVTWEILNALGDLAYPTLFSFKGDTIFEDQYLNLFDKYRHQHNFAFQVSIITADDDLAKLVEVGVPSPTKRLEALKILADMGYWTILRLRPFIIGVTDKTLDELLERALAAGIRGISTEFFAIDHRCTDGMSKRYDWLAKIIGVDNLMKYYTTLSPAERGGYCRLNRDVKEQYIKKIYKFCEKHGLTLGISDPDFKELCTSGSCCAMPDVFPENPEMCNWTRNQLTYHIKECRRNFHKGTGSTEMFFNDVFNDEQSPYLSEHEFANYYIGVISRNAAERSLFTPKLLMQEHWNSIRSPKNPRNYFHGKVTPVRLDGEGNYVFRYVEHDYERRWKKEGIDLAF